MVMKSNIFVFKLYILLLIAAIAAILFIFYGCKNDVAVVKSLTVKEKSPTETSTNMHLYLGESGVVRNEFLFAVMHKYIDPEVYFEYPKGVEVISYTEDGVKETTLTANYAINYEEKKLMEAKYNVVITNHNTGEMVETEHLVWDMDKHIIYSNTQTKNTKSDGSVYIGESFESDEGFTKYSLVKPVLLIPFED